ncbi:hypothetical protein O1611_g2048 [Lasiodiplodia mahajangana]|uniref:Uncharacterized protein n=1 Tax=Lasiodiplodia mahajangana TaxID=1108764 RepID=A0ACC2JVN1_9PEZI|nr:hypothetical protein O1611_g2048 [Lasiodiplodia mahajangana]
MFEKLFVISLPSRSDRRDGLSLAAALSDIELEFIDGVDATSIPEKALPHTSKHSLLSGPAVGAWRGHLNAIQEVVRRNLTSALIVEDDADWDVRIRDQLRNFARSSHALTQPLVDTRSGVYADPTYPNPLDSSPSSVPDLAFDSLPATIDSLTSPYGDEWDILWLGHCGMRFPYADNNVISKGRVVQADQTVPQRKYLWTITDPNDLREQYPDHSRVTHHVQDGTCSLAYAINQRSARKLLYEAGLKDVNAAFDIVLRWFCEGTGEPNRGYHNCLTTTPSLFSIHLPAGPKKHNSDISDHGEGDQEERTELLRWSADLEFLKTFAKETQGNDSGWFLGDRAFIDCRVP